MLKTALVFLSILFSLIARAEFATPSAFEQETHALKALVFLSADCPCSRSHIEHLNALEKKHPDLKIYGVISEPPQDEKQKEKSETYFKNTEFHFPIISDPDQTLVKRYQALKTPHLTLLQRKDKGYEVIYAGGVTNQKDFEKSTVHYLEDNLTALALGQPLKHKNGQSLGCYIRRI